jgi:hypothetical protein
MNRRRRPWDSGRHANLDFARDQWVFAVAVSKRATDV